MQNLNCWFFLVKKYAFYQCTIKKDIILAITTLTLNTIKLAILKYIITPTNGTIIKFPIIESNGIPLNV